MKRHNSTTQNIPSSNPSEFWKTKTSLAVHLYRLLQPPTGEDLDAVYARLYREQFGKRCYCLNSKRMSKLMHRLADLLAEDGLDPTTYIRANFQMLEKWATERDKRTIFPNMLLGYKAKGRYNAFLRKTNRHQDTSHTALDYATQIGRLRRYLYQHELAHGRNLLAFARKGDARSSSQLTSSTPKEHKLLLTQMSSENAFGREVVRLEVALSKIRAAVSIAENQQFGLSTQIGFKPPFRWSPLVTLLARLHQPEPRKTSPTGRNLGQHWGLVK